MNDTVVSSFNSFIKTTKTKNSWKDGLDKYVSIFKSNAHATIKRNKNFKLTHLYIYLLIPLRIYTTATSASAAWNLIMSVETVE